MGGPLIARWQRIKPEVVIRDELRRAARCPPVGSLRVLSSPFRCWVESMTRLKLAVLRLRSVRKFLLLWHLNCPVLSPRDHSNVSRCRVSHWIRSRKSRSFCQKSIPNHLKVVAISQQVYYWNGWEIQLILNHALGNREFMGVYLSTWVLLNVVQLVWWKINTTIIQRKYSRKLCYIPER